MQRWLAVFVVCQEHDERAAVKLYTFHQLSSLRRTPEASGTVCYLARGGCAARCLRDLHGYPRVNARFDDGRHCPKHADGRPAGRVRCRNRRGHGECVACDGCRVRPRCCLRTLAGCYDGAAVLRWGLPGMVGREEPLSSGQVPRWGTSIGRPCWKGWAGGADESWEQLSTGLCRQPPESGDRNFLSRRGSVVPAHRRAQVVVRRPRRRPHRHGAGMSWDLGHRTGSGEAPVSLAWSETHTRRRHRRCARCSGPAHPSALNLEPLNLNPCAAHAADRSASRRRRVWHWRPAPPRAGSLRRCQTPVDQSH